jgi:hypothetical protein
VGHKKYNGLELDERTGGWRVNGSVVRDGERTRLGEEAAERKESFFFGRLASRLGLLGELARYSLSG